MHFTLFRRARIRNVRLLYFDSELGATWIERVTPVGPATIITGPIAIQDFLNRAASSEPIVALPSL